MTLRHSIRLVILGLSTWKVIFPLHWLRLHLQVGTLHISPFFPNRTKIESCIIKIGERMIVIGSFCMSICNFLFKIFSVRNCVNIMALNMLRSTKNLDTCKWKRYIWTKDVRIASDSYRFMQKPWTTTSYVNVSTLILLILHKVKHRGTSSHGRALA